MPRTALRSHEPAVKALASIYAAAAGRILVILKGLDPLTFTASKSARARRTIESEITVLNRKSLAWVKKNIPLAYRDGRRVSEARLAIMGERPKRRDAERQHAKARTKLINQVFADLFKANRSIRQIARRYCNVLVQAADGIRELQAFDIREADRFIARATREAMRGDESRWQLRRRILNYLTGKLEGKDFITINGRNYNLKAYAELVAGVNLRGAQSEAVIRTARQYQHDLVEIPYKMNSCEKCTPYEGRIYSLSGNHPKYPKLEVKVPLHPRCKHILRVVSEGILAERGQL